MESKLPKSVKKGKQKFSEIDCLATYRRVKKQPNHDAAENLKKLMRKLSEKTPGILTDLQNQLDFDTADELMKNPTNPIEVHADDFLEDLYETCVMGLNGNAALERERKKLKQSQTIDIISLY